MHEQLAALSQAPVNKPKRRKEKKEKEKKRKDKDKDKERHKAKSEDEKKAKVAPPAKQAQPKKAPAKKASSTAAASRWAEAPSGPGKPSVTCPRCLCAGRVLGLGLSALAANPGDTETGLIRGKMGWGLGCPGLSQLLGQNEASGGKTELWR